MPVDLDTARIFFNMPRAALVSQAQDMAHDQEDAQAAAQYASTILSTLLSKDKKEKEKVQEIEDFVGLINPNLRGLKRLSPSLGGSLEKLLEETKRRIKSSKQDPTKPMENYLLEAYQNWNKDFDKVFMRKVE